MKKDNNVPVFLVLSFYKFYYITGKKVSNTYHTSRVLVKETYM